MSLIQILPAQPKFVMPFIGVILTNPALRDVAVLNRRGLLLARLLREKRLRATCFLVNDCISNTYTAFIINTYS